MGSDRIQHETGPRLGFARGEKFIAATGVGFISTLILALVVMGWFTTNSVEQANTRLLESNAAQMTSILAAQAELRLQGNDLPGLRRLMLDAGASGGIEHCAVVIPGVGVIASTAATEITIDSLADAGTNPGVGGEQRLVRMLDDGRVEIHEPLQTGSSSMMVLEVTTVLNEVHGLAGKVRTISVIVGAFGLLMTLWIYRRFRAKLGGITAISDSLLAFGDGERRVPCLVVGEMLGKEARAWNEILADREVDDQLIVDRKIEEALAIQKNDGVGLVGACNVLTQGMLVVDQSKRVLYTNGAACSFLGLQVKEGEEILLDEGTVDSELANAVQGVIESGDGARKVIELGDREQIHENGNILKVTIAQIPESEDRRVSVMIQDITQQCLSDESRNSLMAQATHELRTPLTNIKLYVEEAIDAGSDDEAMRDTALNVINKEARRLERVISDMMSVSEIEAGSLSIRVGDLRVDQMVEDLTADYQPQAKEKSITLEFDLPPKMPVLQADRDRIGQALHNLIGNAVKYTPNGGKVHVAFAFDEDDSMRVEVSDTGIGIDPDECEKIFNKFYRADDRRITDVTGSGLGLALAREIARLHGGDITVESAIDHGSTFTFFLPSAERSAQKAA